MAFPIPIAVPPRIQNVPYPVLVPVQSPPQIQIQKVGRVKSGLTLRRFCRRTFACNALATRTVQCKLTLELATTVRYNTKEVVAFLKHALKAYVSDNCICDSCTSKRCTVLTVFAVTTHCSDYALNSLPDYALNGLFSFLDCWRYLSPFHSQFQYQTSAGYPSLCQYSRHHKFASRKCRFQCLSLSPSLSRSLFHIQYLIHVCPWDNFYGSVQLYLVRMDNLHNTLSAALGESEIDHHSSKENHDHAWSQSVSENVELLYIRYICYLPAGRSG